MKMCFFSSYFTRKRGHEKKMRERQIKPKDKGDREENRNFSA